MPKSEGCDGTKADGSPCGAPPSLVNEESGFCPAHDPDNEERRQEIAKKGAEASVRARRGGGLEEDELPPLDGPRAAERWLEVVGRAVATKRLSHNEGKALARVIREYLRAHESGAMEDRVEDLREKVAALKSGDLEVVK